jgi:hypothetical protein
MSYETIFTLANGAAAVGWLLLIIRPRATYTTYLVGYGLLPAAMSLLYVYGLILGFEAFAHGGFGSLVAVRELFANDALLLVGWVHYLAFDLLIGGWITRDGAELGFPHWQIVPALVLTFLLGPVGFFIYWIMRAGRQRALRPLHGDGV